jgi:hypothetical protein
MPFLRSLVTAVAIVAVLRVPTVGAQKRPVQEFTKQGLLVMNFQPGAGTDWRVGRKLGDEVRDRTGSLLNGREVEVIGGK